jgi:type I restriction enzyme, S subunit
MNRKEQWPWRETTIGEIAEIASGQTSKGIEATLSEDGEVCWFKVSSMTDVGNDVEMGESRFRIPVASAQRLKLRIFPAGSIVFPKRGGAIAINRKRRLDVAGALDLNLMALIPCKFEPSFLWWLHRVSSAVKERSNKARCCVLVLIAGLSAILKKAHLNKRTLATLRPDAAERF